MIFCEFIRKGKETVARYSINLIFCRVGTIHLKYLAVCMPVLLGWKRRTEFGQKVMVNSGPRT